MAHAPRGPLPRRPRSWPTTSSTWLADEPVSAYREPWAVRARRWARRHPALVGATTASALVAALLLGSTWAVLRRREADRQGALASRVQAALDAANRHAGAARASGDPAAWAEALAAAEHADDHAALSERSHAPTASPNDPR